MKNKANGNYTCRIKSAAPVTEDIIETECFTIFACAQKWRTMTKPLVWGVRLRSRINMDGQKQAMLDSH